MRATMHHVIQEVYVSTVVIKLNTNPRRVNADVITSHVCVCD